MSKIKRTDQFDIDDHRAELEMLLPRKIKVLILEGSTDRLLLKLLINEAKLLGKKNVKVFSMGSLGSRNCKGDIITLFNTTEDIQNNELVLGLVDKDLDEPLETNFHNLLETEYNDLDCYLIHFSSFFHFAVELLDNLSLRRKLGFFPSGELDRFRDYLVESLIPLSQARIMNNKFRIPFNKILPKSPSAIRGNRHKLFKKFLDENWMITEESLHSFLVQSEKCDRVDWGEFFSEYERKETNSYITVTNGHDLVSLLACIVNESNTHRYKSDLEIEEALRLSTRIEAYEEFSITKKIKSWIFDDAIIPRTQ
ncbi:hypothetical protein Q7A53_09085 [Halobacillus rhizosphaerae]|uniref:hypothetical protein n=1 Tax=Halobacillus rhizosphaerae TaxID=3064889 RepID=UPI00398B7336